MGKFLVIVMLGVALFFSGAWALGLFDSRPTNVTETSRNTVASVTPLEDLGTDLYAAKKFQPIELPKWKNADPIVLYGVMNAFETEEVSSQVPGRVLFIGEQVDDSAVLAAGSAAFLSEPYYFAKIFAGPETFVKFYRRLYEGETVRNGQMLGMVEPSEALGNVLKEMAKVAAAEADVVSSVAAESEGKMRKKTADDLLRNKAIGREDHGAAVLTAIKLEGEAKAAHEKVKIAIKDKHLADIKLHQHEVRAFLSYRTSTIKSIKAGAGSVLKQLEPVVMTVQNLERLMAEAQIEEQYAARLDKKNRVTATIEPTILEAPIHEVQGHTLDVTSVAVARNHKIISGSEDSTVCVWTPYASAPDRKFDHDAAVKVVACSPAGAKENLCIVGCADGSIHIWNLDNDEAKPAVEPIPKAHGGDVSITALAFSPDGKYFASGGSDGSIKIWTTDDGILKYAFVPANGVAQTHEDSVTSLNFTPQGKLISAGRDNSLRVWQLKEKGAAPDGKAILNREGKVSQLGVSRDGQWMLFDQGRSLKMYSVEKRTFIHTLNLPANAMPFDTLAQFSPDGSLMLTAGAPEGRLQLWRTPDEKSRGFEVRQFATREKSAVSSAAFSPDAGKGGATSFAVSAAGHKLFLWAIPTKDEVNTHRLEHVPLTVKTHSLDPSTRTTRIGFEIANPPTELHPHGRFEAGRPVTIVID